MPAGNLAANLKGEGYPKARASFTSRFDRVEEVNDGIIQTQANPRNRWTAMNRRMPVTGWRSILARTGRFPVWSWFFMTIAGGARTRCVTGWNTGLDPSGKRLRMPSVVPATTRGQRSQHRDVQPGPNLEGAGGV
jgi:hypothetical protein